MKIKTIRIKKQSEIPPEKIREVKGMIIALALFASAMIIGAGVLKSSLSEDISASLSELFYAYFSAGVSKKMYRIFLNSLTVNMIFLIISFFAGLNCFGMPVSVSIVIIRGLGMGMFAGYLYSNYTMSGVGYYLLTVFPGAVLSVSAMLAACNISCFLSIDILSGILNKKQNEANILGNYLKKFLFLTAAVVGASMVDCLLTKAFSYLFSF
ncbi:MAG: stage II sporulation protein M [Clostridiales bacterium]|nr:stage II sporulation protein M [Clostridiales bacterium]